MSPLIIFVIIICSITFTLLLFLFFWYLIGVIFVHKTMKRIPIDISKAQFPISRDHSKTFILDRQWAEQKGAEKIFIQSDDGLRLCGHLIKEEGSHLYLLHAHGYKSVWYECTYILHKLTDLLPMNVLMITERSHAESEGKYLTMGWKEGQDICRWVDQIINIDRDAKIILYGDSMGAAAVMCAGGFGLPSNVKCIIEDCGYYSIYEQFLHSASLIIKHGANFVLRSARLIIKNRMKIDIVKQGPLTNLAKFKTPILLIHGDQDDVVPYENMERIYQALPNDIDKQQATFHAVHALSFYMDETRYLDIVKKFIERFI